MEGLGVGQGQRQARQGRRGAVKGVTDDRVSKAGQVNADLVSASC